MNKKVIALIVVIILIVIGVGVAILINNNSSFIFEKLANILPCKIKNSFGSNITCINVDKPPKKLPIIIPANIKKYKFLFSFKNNTTNNIKEKNIINPIDIK